MKIVKFLGGLGNQMFQYAFYLSLSERFSNVKADLTGFKSYNLHHGFELEKVFDIKLKRASTIESWLYDNEDRRFLARKIRRVLGTKHAFCLEKQYFGFEPEVYQKKATTYYWGYWQNWNYLKHIEPILQEHFVFKNRLEGKNLDLLKTIRNRNSISLHVRRGDYLENTLLGNICDLPYFDKALDVIKTKVNEPLFVIFSNDIPWCKENLGLDNCIYVDWNLGSNSYLDMQLMSKCKHNIISNSSFSWWAAYLNNFPDKIVISPKQWMNLPELDYSGLILKRWISI